MTITVQWQEANQPNSDLDFDRQSGMTRTCNAAHAASRLIELMLALALGIVVTAGIVTLFVGNNQTYTLLNGQSRMQENARFALDFIKEQSRSSGFYWLRT